MGFGQNIFNTNRVKSMVELREINEKNYEECFRLKASVENEDFVDTVTYSLAEAWVFYGDTKAFAIYQDDKMAGFVSMYTGEENCQIINFLIDDAHRGKGLGTEAAKLCINYLREEHGAARISVPVEVRHTAAQQFWRKLGFDFSDSIEDGYVFMRMPISGCPHGSRRD